MNAAVLIDPEITPEQPYVAAGRGLNTFRYLRRNRSLLIGLCFLLACCCRHHWPFDRGCQRVGAPLRRQS
jgi:hypothetical protein